MCAGELLDWLQRNTTMLLYDGVRRFRLWPQFRAFLLEMERTYSRKSAAHFWPRRTVL